MLMRCLQREFRLCFYRRGSLFNALLFLLVIASLYPLATSVESKTLRFIGPGVIWVCALLSMMLSMQTFFKSDYQDGSLDYLLLMPSPFTYYVGAKLLVHWFYFTVPLLLLTPIIALCYQLSGHAILLIIVGLFLGAPSLLLIGAIIAALTLRLQNNGVLVLLMALPLYVPILIFGTSAVENAVPHQWPLAAFGFMAAIAVLSISVLPVAISATLKLSIKQ